MSGSEESGRTRRYAVPCLFGSPSSGILEGRFAAAIPLTPPPEFFDRLNGNALHFFGNCARFPKDVSSVLLDFLISIHDLICFLQYDQFRIVVA